MGQNTYVSEEMQYGTRNESKARDRYIQDEMIGHDDLKVSPCGLRIPPGTVYVTNISGLLNLDYVYPIRKTR